LAHSSSGLGHLPLKEEITGSNPVCATNDEIAPCFEAKCWRQGACFCRFVNNLSIMVGDRLLFTFRIEKSVKALCGGFLQTGSDMAVDVERHFNGGMA
jgi:hypothetical protein